MNNYFVKAVNRLYNDWQKHGKIIIALDYDDTISPYLWDDQKDFEEVMEVVREAQSIGAYVTVWSACDNSRFGEIETFCKNNNIKLSSINKNPIPLDYGHYGKIYANIYLDDKSGLEQALDILKTTIYRIKSQENNNII